jgi:hypothetical protein
MKYFGTKQAAQIDENAVAAERLMSIASRFKSNVDPDLTVETPGEPREAPKAPDEPN